MPLSSSRFELLVRITPPKCSVHRFHTRSYSHMLTPTCRHTLHTLHTHTYTHSPSRTHTYTHTHTRTHTRAHTHTHTHTHTHPHTQAACALRGCCWDPSKAHKCTQPGSETTFPTKNNSNNTTTTAASSSSPATANNVSKLTDSHTKETRKCPKAECKGKPKAPVFKGSHSSFAGDERGKWLCLGPNLRAFSHMRAGALNMSFTSRMMNLAACDAFAKGQAFLVLFSVCVLCDRILLCTLPSCIYLAWERNLGTKPLTKPSFFFTNTAGQWSEWGEWSACAGECGHGTRTRTRSCIDGSQCPHSATHTQCCENPACRM